MSKLTKSRSRFALETLEDRVTPALAFAFNGSNLLVTGSPVGALTVAQNAADVTVTDGSGAYVFAVTGNVSFNFANAPVTATFNVANPTAGGFSFKFGNAANTLNIAGGSTVNGNLTVTGGSLADTINSSAALNVAGNTSINLGAGNDPVNLLFGTFGGNLLVANANSLAFGGGGTTVGGLLQVTANDNLANTWSLNADVSGGTYLTGGTLTDTVTLAAGTYSGNVVANLGNGANAFTAAAGTTVGGSLTVVGGNAADTVNLNGTVGGNLTLSLGGSGLTLATDNEANINGTINGSSITYIGGSGRDTVAYGATAPGARLSAYLGDGADSFALNTASLASAYIDFGNGADVFTSAVAISFPFTTRNL